MGDSQDTEVFDPLEPAEAGTVSYAANGDNYYKSVPVRGFEDGTDVVVLPLSAYLAAREFLIYEAGYSVGEALKLLGMWPETKP